jgi:hypothetical protein
MIFFREPATRLVKRLRNLSGFNQTLQTHFEVERLPARVGSFATKSYCPENDRQWKPVGSAKAPKKKFARSELCSRSSHPGCAK